MTKEKPESRIRFLELKFRELANRPATTKAGIELKNEILAILDRESKSLPDRGVSSPMTISSHIAGFITSITPDLESKDCPSLICEHIKTKTHTVEIRIERNGGYETDPIDLNKTDRE